jgi:hypothetical protein
MMSLKHKISTTLTRGTIDWCKIASNTATNKHYNNILLASTETIAMSYEDFNKSIIAAGTEAALRVISTCDNWFQFSVSDLAPIIAERNEVLDALRSTKSLPPSIVATMRDSLQCLSKHVKDKVLIAKAKWAAHLCSKIHDMSMNPRIAWEHICLLTGGTIVHHKKKVTMAMMMADRKLATNGKENMPVFGPHFNRVLNNHQPVNPTVLTNVPDLSRMLGCRLGLGFWLDVRN